MQVSVQTLSSLEREISVAVPAERIDAEINNRLDALSKRAKVAGFRPGKVPMSVIRQRYGDQVNQEVLGEMLQTSFYEAVSREKLRPAGAPRISTKGRASGQPLEYTAKFEVYPEIKVATLAGVTVERPVAEISESDVDNVIENIRKQRMEWHAVERPSKTGDRARIDFHGKKGGEDFPGNQAENMPIELGKGRMIPGFEDRLTGVAAGADVSFDLVFPADYHAQELQNQTVHFDVKVIAVEESRLPQLDESFVRALGISEGTVDALRKDVRQNMQREMSDRARAVLKQNVLDALIRANTIDVPHSLVEQEMNVLKSGQQQPVSTPEFDAKLEVLARRRVALGLLLAEIVKQNQIKVEPKKLREAVEHFASTYEKPDEVVRWYYSDKKRLGEVESFVLENEVVDWLVSSATLKDVSTSFDALIKQGQTAA
jgi:trigger factor